MEKYFYIILFLCSIVYSQEIFKEDLTKLFDSIPTPPRSCEEAFIKSNCNLNSYNDQSDLGKYDCKIFSTFKNIYQKLEFATADTIKREDKVLFFEVMPKSLETQSYQKSIEPKRNDLVLTPAQKKESNKNSEKQLVAKILEIAQKIEKLSAKYNSKDYERKNESKILMEEFLNKYQTVDVWEQVKINELPDIVKGAASYKDPNEIRLINKSAMQQRVEIANQQILFERTEWQKEMNEIKLATSPYLETLVKLNYGERILDSAKINKIKKAQKEVGLLINRITSKSEKIYNLGRDYYIKLRILEK